MQNLNTIYMKEEDFYMDMLLRKYEKNSIIYNIISHCIKDCNVKSIIELNLSEDEVKEVENIFFQLRCDPKRLNCTEKAFVGLLFLIYVVYGLEVELDYSMLWRKIVKDLERYSTVTKHFHNSYFTSQNQPNSFLKESLKFACTLFRFRNNYENKDEQQYIRNTILLQIGLLNNSLDHLKLWLSNYSLPVIVSELLDVNSENYSKEFSDGWRVLRRYRDNILSNEKAKNILTQNIWFKHLNLNHALEATKQKTKKIMITQDEDLPIFYLDKICYFDDGLAFVINAQDLYSLNLSGFRYEIHMDGAYNSVLLSNSSKELVLESAITLVNPERNCVDLEVINEDGDVVYSAKITLFDFTEQIVLFDEDGNIYGNIFKKLNPHKKYHVLMDSDLDSSFNGGFQREYFQGYALLVPFIGHGDDFKITYNDEILFQLNFTEYIQKPDFINHLVLYATTNKSFVLNAEYTFELKIMDINLVTQEGNIEEFPKNVKIIKWVYHGGYADDIKNATMVSKLYPEMIISPKHTLIIKYKNRIFKKVVHCNFFEKRHLYRLFQIANDGRIKLVESETIFTKDDLKKYKYFLSSFGATDPLYLKNKSKFYQTIKPNQILKFYKFTGYAETIFVTKYLFNSSLVRLFKYIDSDDFISICEDKPNEIVLKKELPEYSKIVLFQHNLKELELSKEHIKTLNKNNKFICDDKLILAIVIQNNRVIDSSNDKYFLDNFSDYNNMEIVKKLILSNHPFLLKDTQVEFLKRSIVNNFEEFFSIFYSNTIWLNNNLLQLNFSKIMFLIDHVLFDLDFDSKMSSNVLKKIVDNRQEKLLISTPIVLFRLLNSSKQKWLIKHFLNQLNSATQEVERDDSFVEDMVDFMFEIETLDRRKKHNLKVAMHHMNGEYYLKKVLERLNG